MSTPVRGTNRIFVLQTGSRARRFAAADVPGRTGRGKVSLGGRVHHERSATHRKRFPLVAVQRVVFPSLLKVSVVHRFFSSQEDNSFVVFFPPILFRTTFQTDLALFGAFVVIGCFRKSE